MNWLQIIGMIVQYGAMAEKLIAEAGGSPAKWLQEGLNIAVQPSPNLVVDGIIGPKTQAAVQAFEREVGIPTDGIPGLLVQLFLTQVLSKL